MTHLRTVAPFLLPVCTGALLALVFFFPTFSPVLFVAFLPTMWFFHRYTRGISTGAIAGFLLAFTYFFCALATLEPSQEAKEFILVDVGGLAALGVQDSWSFDVMVLAVRALVAAWGGVAGALWGVGTAYVWTKRGPVAGVLAFAVLWVLFEYVRRALFFTLSWSDIGYAFVEYPIIAVTARMWGKYGLALLVIAVNGLLFLFAVRRDRRMRIAALGVVVACVALGLGAFLTQRTLRTLHAGEKRTLAVFQGYVPWNVPLPEETQEGFRFPSPYDMLLEKVQGSRDLLLFPEELIHEYPLDIAEETFPTPDIIDSQFWQREREELQRQLARFHARAMVFGQPLYANGAFSNAMLAVSQNGDVSAYPKQKLFPIAEQTPWLLQWTWLARRPVYTPGTTTAFLQTDAGHALLLSCLEVEDDALFHRYLTADPSVILASGSEIGFNEHGRRYQLQLARFRALEQDKYLARATKRGWSVILDPLGRPIAQASSTMADEVLTGEVVLRSGKTPIARMGNLPILGACVLLSLVLLRYAQRSNH